MKKFEILIKWYNNGQSRRRVKHVLAKNRESLVQQIEGTKDFYENSFIYIREYDTFTNISSENITILVKDYVEPIFTDNFNVREIIGF